MYPIVIAFATAGVMTCLGMVLRTKVKFLSNMLVPVNVIAGILGLIFMNTVNDYIFPMTTVSEYNLIVDVFFTFSFISIGLASVSKPKEKKSNKKEEKTKTLGGASIVKGALGMGIIWSFLFGITAVMGVGIISLIGKIFGLNPVYGMLIPYAFCQGPGQAANMGMIFETQYGFENAQMVGVTFAVVGFIAAFVIGVPLARYGLKKKLAKNSDEISGAIIRGYYTVEEQRESMGKVTTHSGNIETLALHLSFMGICYLLAVAMSKVVLLIPVVGAMFGNMLFLWGMIAAYLVKGALRKLKVDYLISIPLQNKITGFTSDFLVVCAFMAIKVSVIGAWIVPIVIECIIVSLFTAFICTYFMSRLGSTHDFERVLGMYGMCTGTTPSGIALARIVDPKLKTPVATELGMTNIFMMLSIPITLPITFYLEDTMTFMVALGIIFVVAIIYLVMMKICGVWNKPSFSLVKGVKYNKEDDDSLGSAGRLIQGVLRHEINDSNVGVVK